eukprot:2569671-Ditylum_brightwellii.AAC.1
MARKTESGQRKSVGINDRRKLIGVNDIRKVVGVNDRRKTAGVYDGRALVGSHNKRTKIVPGSSAKKMRDEESEELFDTKNGICPLENILHCTQESKLK